MGGDRGARGGAGVNGPVGRARALSYAKNRFGGAEGEIHVYDQAGAEIEGKS